jgi:hypothetical protein
MSKCVHHVPVHPSTMPPVRTAWGRGSGMWAGGQPCPIACVKAAHRMVRILESAFPHPAAGPVSRQAGRETGPRDRSPDILHASCPLYTRGSLMVECHRLGWEGTGAWRDGRVDEGGGLENRCGATHRGFESLSLRLMGPWGGAGAAERGRLLSACRGKNLYRGFESLPPRL